jgi:hypothetical protein
MVPLFFYLTGKYLPFVFSCCTWIASGSFWIMDEQDEAGKHLTQQTCREQNNDDITTQKI